MPENTVNIPDYSPSQVVMLLCGAMRATGTTDDAGAVLVEVLRERPAEQWKPLLVAALLQACGDLTNAVAMLEAISAAEQDDEDEA